MLGGTASGERYLVKERLDHKLGPDDSALTIVIKRADWARMHEQAGHFGGEGFIVELTPETEAQLEALSTDEAAAATVQADVEVETVETDK